MALSNVEAKPTCLRCGCELRGDGVCPMCKKDPPRTLSELVKAADQAPASDGAGNAKKMDLGKPPVVQGFMQYFPRSIVAVSYVSEYGDRKYSKPEGPHYTTQWQEVPNGEKRYADADGRHRTKIPLEGDYDAESEIAHLAHKAWNALAELEHALKSGRIQQRIGNELKDGKPLLGTFKVVG